MSKNLMARYMNVPKPNHPKSNFGKDFRNVTSADIGYGIPIFTDEIMGNSNVTLDIKAAMFTNATVAPLYSRFKMQVTAWWCPMSAYVNALRDGVRTDATTDYAFPVINFDYDTIFSRIQVLQSEIQADAGHLTTTSLLGEKVPDYASFFFGDTFPYIPTASIYSYLRMWPSNFSPVKFVGSHTTPPPVNAIPLLMYYDIFRNYIINNQENESYIRQQSFHPVPDNYKLAGRSVNSRPVDYRITRDMLDDFFASIRIASSSYQQNEPYDVSNIFSRTFGGLFPNKKVYFLNKAEDGSPLNTDIEGMVKNNLFIPDYHYGLWRDTYLNDPYVAFISDDNVNYERETARLVIDSTDTASGEELSLTMEQIRVGSMLQNFVRSHIFRNNAFDEYVDVEYGCRPARNLDKPMFLGSISSYMVFNDVIAQAQTGDSLDVMDKQQLGSRSAVGEGHMFTGKYRSKDKKGHYERPFVKFHAPEPGYLMLILTIKPEVAYFEGYDPMYDKHTIFDLYRPSLRNIGYQDKCYRHINLVPNLALDSTGSMVNGLILQDRNGISTFAMQNSYDFATYDIAYAHEPYGFEYMAKPNIITGQMSEIGTYLHWTNARSVNNVFDSPISDGSYVDTRVDLLSTTILPEMYHYVFANDQNLDNFQFFFDFDYNVYQPQPHTILSFK